jgi:DNA-binding transcriptional LysR family regulator
MELRHMRYFVAVAEHLHFGRAAESLMTAQPSLSRQIHQLEDELGVSLFDRSKHHVELTDAGRIFLADARRTLQAADASVRHARESADGTRGELRLGFIAGAMMMRLPAILHEYRSRFPNVDVIPNVVPYPEHASALHAGTIDLAWTIALPDPEIESLTITSDGLLAAIASSHPLATRKQIDVADLAGEDLVILSHALAPVLHDDLIQFSMANGFRPGRIHEGAEAVTVLGLVAAGYGVALVPFPWSVMSIPGTTFVNLSQDFRLQETLSWRRDRHTQIVQTFIETTVSMLSRETA